MRNTKPTYILIQPLTTVERMAKHFRVVEECWLWHGSSIRAYGGFMVAGHLKLAHRVMFELVQGREIQAGKVLDHLCRNGRCIRPAHLEEVTQQENVHRGDRHKPKGACSRGHMLAGENLIVDWRGWRYCRTCKLARQRAYKQGLRTHA